MALSRPAILCAGLMQLLQGAALLFRLGRLLIAACLALGVVWGSAKADTTPPGKRIALVIGIDAYRYADHLKNPDADARSVGDALRTLGFDVAEVFDPDERAMSESIRAFGIKAQNADVALVYYAGHGVQVDHENYLLPADARVERERDLLYEGVPLSLVLGEVAQAGKIGIVLLDSCRNNPFVERMTQADRKAGRPTSISVGLARVDSLPRNTLVAMSTRANEVAADGVEHSPFATALVGELQVPGEELGLFFRSVHDRVLAATGNRQEPYSFSALGAEPFYLHPRPPNRPPQIGAISPLRVADNASPTPLGLPRPTDPDGDSLTIRIIGLPEFGDIRIAGRPVARDAVIPLDSFMTATYQPSGKTLGIVGSLDFLIEDGQGNSVAANLPISVVASHHPAIVEAPRLLRVFPQALGIAPPHSDDGDPLTVVVLTLPRGSVRNGDALLRVGDRLTPEDLSKLTFMPEAGFSGSAGILLYSVDNGRGDTIEGRLDIEVATKGDVTDAGSVAALWETLRANGSADDLQAFLRLFPHSRHAADARTRLAGLLPAKETGVAGSTAPSAALSGAPSAAPTSPPAEPALSTSPSIGPRAASTPAPRMTPPQPNPPRPATPDARVPPPVPPPVPPVVEASRIINPPPASMPPASTPGSAVTRSGAEGRAASEFTDCPTCPTMIRIAAGTFTMGYGSKAPEASPAHLVTVREFALQRFPVTIAEWQACVTAAGCKSMPRMATSDGRVPVHNVSWDDASQYISWLSRVSGKTYRLPSEAEWEYAARAGTTSRYWWGEAIGVNLANCLDCGGQENPRAPLPVDLFRPNPFGLVDMLGGVEQWTADCWMPNYHDAPADAAPRTGKDCEKRVLRGGSFRSDHDELTITSRNSYDQSVRYQLNGFRVARDLP